jgi:inner membrane protein
MCVGVVAANAPDVDLLYTNLLAGAPLGYLLHHRGHSHTLPGLAALGVLIWSASRLLPRIRAGVSGVERRSVLLIGAALLSHLLMDSANGYGTHPFYPFSTGWFYGDAVFVLEPWLWAILGAALAVNAGHLWRLAIAFLTIVPISALLYLGIVRGGVAVALLAVVGVATMAARPLDRQRRAAAALLATAAIFLSMAGISRIAKSEATTELAALGGTEVVDVVADVNPGVPWCWGVLTLHRTTAQPKETLIANRATLSLLPCLFPAAACASARLSAGWSTDVPASEAIVWHRRWQIDVEQLRALYTRTCRARAWLQFGRVPYVSNGHIIDLRFENPLGQNFTSMAIDAGAGPCPRDLTAWEPPRLDVLTPRADRP